MKSKLIPIKYNSIFDNQKIDPEIRKIRDEILKAEFSGVDDWFLPLLKKLKNSNGTEEELAEIWKGKGSLEHKHLTKMFRYKLRELEEKYDIGEVFNFETLWTNYKLKIVKVQLGKRLRREYKNYLRKKRSRKVSSNS
ncbi:hypothetical protein [Leptospira kmetyi]|uniref:Uncharacterized protein n=1 Tax=Leptospira kmetyi TaxID=408139 RepID=A0ABX4N6X0_9LEPT|nr:hypothetical protein [Leptospira kmetyi]PJZ29066.1 hypothetical protein CH378_14350 [Leptospira kmetyi]PJZ39690.1 hypothetical protein CH370_19735 [Leptospira kmetyi]